MRANGQYGFEANYYQQVIHSQAKFNTFYVQWQITIKIRYSWKKKQSLFNHSFELLQLYCLMFVLDFCVEFYCASTALK